MKKIFIFSIIFLFISFDLLSQTKNDFTGNDSLKLNNYFELVSKLMDEDKYDSAQFWLDKIDTHLSIKKPNVFSYLFHSRQAEIYYFNDLMDIAILEIEKGLAIANKLEIDEFKADSYNLLALFYYNLNRLEKAEEFALSALFYSKNKNKLVYNYSLSEKYHIFGILSQIQFKRLQYQKALITTDSTIKEATLKSKNRIIAIAIYTKGAIYFQLNQSKQAISSFQKSKATCLNSLDLNILRDVYLAALSGIAKTNAKLGNTSVSKSQFFEALNYYKKQKGMNRYYSLLFINEAITFFISQKNFETLAELYKIKSEIERQSVEGSQKKIETIVNISVHNERALLKSELNELKLITENSNRIKLYILAISILMLAFLGYLIFSNRKLRNKNIELNEKNKEISEALLLGQTTERKRVASDLHDNLGSTLSSIGWSMDAIDQTKMSKKEQGIYKNLQTMIASAYDEVRLLSHNLLPEELEKQGLATALQTFVRKLNNSSTKTHFELTISENFDSLDKKKEFELYSISLELVNNILKHSKATEAKIELSKNKNEVSLLVSDNGIGIFKNESDGKGMKNVQARVDSLRGKWELSAIENEGTESVIVVPV